MSGMIETAWTNYEKKVLPLTVSLRQHTETKRAFYAGAAIVYGGLISGLGEGDDDDAELAILEGLKAELERWAEAVKKGWV